MKMSIFSPSAPWRLVGEVEVYLHSFFTLALDDSVVDFTLRPFTLPSLSPAKYTGTWMGSQKLLPFLGTELWLFCDRGVSQRLYCAATK